MSPHEKYGKRIQITFRITPLAMDKLKRAAALFRMTPGEYTKAVLYRDLGIFTEPLDQRRRSWKQKQKRLQQLEEEEDDRSLSETDDIEEWR